MSKIASQGLKKRIVRAGSWTMAGYGMSQVLRLGGNLVMTRLLVPEMFGVMAIAHMLMTSLALFSDFGLRQNIVQSRHGDDADFLDTAWTVQIARGFLICGVALAIALLLYVVQTSGQLHAATVYADPILPSVIILLSITAIIAGFQSTKVATAYRYLNQMKVTLIDLYSQVAGLVVMVVWGWLNRSIWALVAGSLVSSLISTVLSHSMLDGSSNRLGWNKDAARELLGFGKWILLSSVIGILAINADRILLGGLVDARTLGLYAIAYLIISAFENGISKLFMTVSLPVLSEVARQDRTRLRETYYKLSLPVDTVLLFCAGFLFSSGQLLIALLYDQRYAEAGSMLQVLSFSLIAVRFGTSHQIYLALGAPRLMMAINIVRLLALLILLPVLFRWFGFEGALWGIALHTLATAPFVYVFNARFGILDIKRELMSLPALPAGWLCGWVMSDLLSGWIV